MNKLVLSSLLTVFLLSACGLTRDDLGVEKSAPDEMLVVSRAPLSVPPEFGLRPLVVDDGAADEAPKLSAGEQALVSALK